MKIPLIIFLIASILGAISYQYQWNIQLAIVVIIIVALIGAVLNNIKRKGGDD